MRTRAPPTGGGQIGGSPRCRRAGHPDVHQHDVGLCSHCWPLFAVGGGCDDSDVVLGFEQRGEAGAHCLLVVGYNDA